MNELALFAGAGGGILGGMLLGWRTVCAVEIDPYCRRVLLARQRDGILTPFPVWDDVRTFDGRPWRGHADIITGGFPCQDISTASRNGRGLNGERSGLWSEFARIIGEVRPKYVFVENSPALRVRGLDRVLSDLASLGFDARWGCVGTDKAGGPCQGRRIWIVATANGVHVDLWMGPDETETRQPVRESGQGKRRQGEGSPWVAPPDQPPGVDHGLAYRVERTRAVGNGQVPAVAALAWEMLTSDGGPK